LIDGLYYNSLIFCHLNKTWKKSMSGRSR